MAQQTSVVTPERFAQGMTYDEYMESVKVNKARIEEYYDNVSLESGQTDALRELSGAEGGPARMMVIGEDWCGDVVRELPVLARVAEAAGLELRIFPRDENHDIMNEFLKEGKYMSIPVAVFYDEGTRVHLPLDRAFRSRQPRTGRNRSGHPLGRSRYFRPGFRTRSDEPKPRPAPAIGRRPRWTS